MKTLYLYTTVFLACLFIWDSRGQDTTASTANSSLATAVKPVPKSRKTYPYQTSGFNSSIVTSGPILIIDKKTIFISNLMYDGSYRNAHFWVGTGTPSPTGTLVPDENNLSQTLKSYQGRNIYLKLPGNLTINALDYIGIWSQEGRGDLGHVVLFSKNTSEARDHLPEPGFDRKTADNKTIFRVPKCCPLNQHFINLHCTVSDEEMNLWYNVYDSNETHIDKDVFLNNTEFIPYEYSLQCPPNYYRFPLDPEEALGFIYNASLVYEYPWLKQVGILSHGQFCVENEGRYNRTVFLTCSPPETTVAYFVNLYFPFLIISTICFFISAVCYHFILKVKEVQKKCFVGYAASMTFTFFSLILLQQVNTGCSVLGGLFLLSTLCSFTWLACLCFDLMLAVRHLSDDENIDRIYWYIGMSVALPVIFLIISLVPTGIPDVPNSFMKKYSDQLRCTFTDCSLTLFFVPIGVLMLISFVALCYTFYMISKYEKTKMMNQIDWLEKRTDLKFMLRSCFLVWTTSCIWLVEALVNNYTMASGLQFAIDIIEASQGMFAIFIFVTNRYTRKQVIKAIKKDNKRDQGHILDTRIWNLDKLTNDDSDGEDDERTAQINVRTSTST